MKHLSGVKYLQRSCGVMKLNINENQQWLRKSMAKAAKAEIESVIMQSMAISKAANENIGRSWQGNGENIGWRIIYQRSS